MLITHAPIGSVVFKASARDTATAESVVVDDGRILTIHRDVTGARYRLDGQPAYASDAGTVLSGILVWGSGASQLHLPAGGRRRDRTMIRGPRFLRRELYSGEPIRVFHQRLGDLWAVERPGRSIIVRNAVGEVLEYAKCDAGRVGPIEVDRPWHWLSEEQHVGHIALWAQVLAFLGETAAVRALAEDVRVAAFDAADLPACTVQMILDHIALRDRDLSRSDWGARFQRRMAAA